MNNLEKIKLKMSTLFVINKWIAHQSEPFDRQLDGNVRNAILCLWPGMDDLLNHLNEKLSNMWMILQVLSLSCFLRCSRILISSCACLWNLFSFLTILRATCWWVLWSYTLSTCPNDPFPITFRISYLGEEKHLFSTLSFSGYLPVFHQIQCMLTMNQVKGCGEDGGAVNWNRRWFGRLWMKRGTSGTLHWLSHPNHHTKWICQFLNEFFLFSTIHATEKKTKVCIALGLWKHSDQEVSFR